MERFTLGKYTLNDFADYLNGENNYFDGIVGNELFLTGEVSLTKTLNLHFPITVTGEECTIVGENNEEFAINIYASNTTVQGLTLKNFKFGVEVDGMGKTVENVWVKNIVMDGGLNAVEVGSTLSNSTLKNIHVEGCKAIVAREEWEEDIYAAVALSYNFCCARYKSGGMLENCVMEGLYVDNCSKVGQSRVALNYMSGMPYKGNFGDVTASYNNLVTRNINFTNNHFGLCWDGLINVVDKFINVGDCYIDGVNISGNYGEHGIVGVYMYGCEPIFGAGVGGDIRNVTINNNHFVVGIEDVGEPIRSIWVSGTRADSFIGLVSNDATVSNVEIAGNKLEGGGIVVCGSYAFLDGEMEQKNNLVKDVNIHHNEIIGADVAFQFDGAQVEGRRHDWNFGYPRHNMEWMEKITDDSVVTNVITNNRVENLTCVDNVVEGYRYRVKASGVTAHGHGICTDNKVGGNIIFERNKFGVGENHIHVANVIADDFVRDNGGNEVSETFKLKK